RYASTPGSGAVLREKDVLLVTPPYS
ncbi:MAG: hypothetical protein QOJ23_3728, partial [Actinomycetota bacterium]|nr:hypothetical protein [Actinomycetota bacterium]